MQGWLKRSFDWGQKIRLSASSGVVAENSVLRGPWRRERTALQLGVVIARVSKDCERTHVTLNGDLLVKVIDEHDVAVHIADE